MKKIFTAAAAVCLMLSGCNNNNKPAQNEEPAAAEETASLAKLSGIAYSKNTVNKKEGKKVLVISSSPRKGGNTDLLCDEFAKGAQEAGGNVEKIFLADYKLEFLSEEGANSPQKDPHTSDTWKLVEKFLNAEVVCMASPTYYMNVDDRMKTFIDATYLAFGDERMGGKEFYYITACADPSENTAEWCLNGFRGFVMCLPSATERGYVKATSMSIAGAVKDSEYMQQAYELGKGINE